MHSNFEVKHHGIVMDVITEDDPKYEFFPISCGSVQFKVRARHDAHIVLTTKNNLSDPMYEIIIGDWANQRSVIKRSGSDPGISNSEMKVDVETPRPLDKDEYQSFWVRWDNGTISVGRQRDMVHFMSWIDPEPFLVAYVGVATGRGATGSWQIEDDKEINTSDRLDYKFRPVTTGYVEFEYRGPHDAHLCLTNEPSETDAIYEFILGGSKNTRSVISRNKKNEKVVSTPGLVHPNEFRKFLIQWTNGRLFVRNGEGSGETIVDWADPSPFPVTYFGVRTSFSARGHWRIRHFPAGTPINIKDEPAHGSSGRWVGARGGQAPPGAVVGGRSRSGEPLFVARASHASAIVPGMLVQSKGYACIPWGGREHAKTEYQVLVDVSDKWMVTSGSNIPANAFPAGHTESRDPLYVGRVKMNDAIITGKVQKTHGVCYVPYNGEEVSFTDYEILLL